MSNLLNEEQVKTMVLSILEMIDLSRPSITIFLLDRGDMSRYHEIITLQQNNNEWFLIEDYSTPEYTYANTSKIKYLSVETLNNWIESFILINKDVFLCNAACPKDGLALP